MTRRTPVAPRAKGRATLEDTVFALDRGELSADDREAWEPRRQRLVREWWQVSGTIGLGVSAMVVALRHLQHPALGVTIITAVDLFLYAILIGTGVGVTLVPKQVAQKRDEFVRSRRLREEILRDGNA